MGSQTSKPSRSRGTTATALPPVQARPEHRHGRRAGPPGGGTREGGQSPGPAGGRDLREGGQGPGVAGGRDLREGGPRSALRCAAERGSPADGVRLAGLRLRGAGGGGRCRGLRQGRQRPVSSCRSSVRRLSGARRVPAVQRSKECVAFPCGIWHLVYCYGNEILQLQKGNARDNCWCQFTDGWTAWIADDGKTY